MEVSTVAIKTKIKNTLLDRDTVLEEIEEAITFRMRNHKAFLYHIYYVGGIGKSFLKKALKKRLEAAGVYWRSV